MVGSAVDTIVESNEASAIPSISATKMNINRRFVSNGIVGSSILIEPGPGSRVRSGDARLSV